MEKVLEEIIAAIKADGEELDQAWLEKLLRRHNRGVTDIDSHISKKRLYPFYLDVKANDPQRWKSWDVDELCEERLQRLLRAKPRRTASGVATVTVITKPWICTSNCVYCPNDVRMPKSYLAGEPACKRAERNYFDPYLQVSSRLKTLESMGHVTDKVELIVLGGTWSDYPEDYQIWFIRECFRALNDAGAVGDGNDIRRAATVRKRENFYRDCGIEADSDELAQATASQQQAVNANEKTYNQVVSNFYCTGAWEKASVRQQAHMEELEYEQQANENALHRMVGLVIETRPDLISVPALRLMRNLGCTKVQMGIQSLDPDILLRNERDVSIAQIKRSFALLRLFGYKIHVHFMVNLLGATAESDKIDYLHLVTDPSYLPDEIKLYPCALVESSRLTDYFETGQWRPYSVDELVEVLQSDVSSTPPYMRISRMVRDIAAEDILAGNKKANLRQRVEKRLRDCGACVQEIRMREISTDSVDSEELTFECVSYQTTVSEERFLQWITPDNRIAGFLRLSLPSYEKAEEMLGDEVHDIPAIPGEAMIREVHVYGKVARLHGDAEGSVQHMGLGHKLVKEACDQAYAAGFTAINVISSVGTRSYYRNLGFQDDSLYQRMPLAGALTALRDR